MKSGDQVPSPSNPIPPLPRSTPGASPRSGSSLKAPNEAPSSMNTPAVTTSPDDPQIVMPQSVTDGVSCQLTTGSSVGEEQRPESGKPFVTAPIPPSEEQRIARLLGFEILDTGNDPRLDRLTRLASIICDVPAAMISLIDRNRQWFKSVYGLPIRETPRDISFCAHAIMDPERIFVVPDTTKDPRFATNPLVTESQYIRFYAGAPLVTED